MRERQGLVESMRGRMRSKVQVKKQRAVREGERTGGQ